MDSWTEALAGKKRQDFGNVKLEARNELSAYLTYNHKERRKQWNTLTAEVKPHVVALATSACQSVELPEARAKALLDQVTWDWLAACMEYEYADLMAPALYDRLAGWYLRGHFPCGWQGNFPRGSLEVY